MERSSLSCKALFDEKIHVREELLGPAEEGGIWFEGTFKDAIAVLKKEPSKFAQSALIRGKKSMGTFFLNQLGSVSSGEDVDVVDVVSGALSELAVTQERGVWIEDMGHFIADVLEEAGDFEDEGREAFWGRADLLIPNSLTGELVATVECRFKADQHFLVQAVAAMIGFNVGFSLMVTCHEFALLYRLRPEGSEDCEYYRWPKTGLAKIEDHAGCLVDVMFELGRVCTDQHMDAFCHKPTPRVLDELWTVVTPDGAGLDLACYDFQAQSESIQDKCQEASKDPWVLSHGGP